MNKKRNRDKNRSLFILGITGSIAMGKTMIASKLALEKRDVFDADKAVRKAFLRKNALSAKILERFPAVEQKKNQEATSDQEITNDQEVVSRAKLAKIVFDAPAELAWLESILHPFVRAEMRHFIRWASINRCRRIALDIPLLYESGHESLCDTVFVATAPVFLQKRRLQKRGLSKKQQDAILKRQWPDQVKRLKADYIIRSGLGEGYMMHEIKKSCQKSGFWGEKVRRTGKFLKAEFRPLKKARPPGSKRQISVADSTRLYNRPS